MNKLLLAMAIASSINCSLNAQIFEWARSFGSVNNFESGHSITVDASGNVYTTGEFEGTVDFNPGPGTMNLTSEGSKDIFVHKMDASGNLLWAKSFGDNASDESNAIVTYASGNVYFTGFYAGTVDFDPGSGTTNLTSAGSQDIYVTKLDSSGNLVWARSFGGTGYDQGGYSITVDSLGNVYTTGLFVGTADFDPGPSISNLTSSSGIDVFVSKLDASGSFVWVKQLGGQNGAVGHSIVADDSNSVYITGVFSGTVDFDPGPSTTNLTSIWNKDVYVQKLDASDNFVWAKSFGGGNLNSPYIVRSALDGSGNLYTAGHFSETVDFDPSSSITNLTSVGSRDVFVQKMDTSGGFIWARAFGGADDADVAYSISLDIFGNVYTTGRFYGTADFDPGASSANITSAGAYDVFVQKMDASGNFVWARAIGGMDIETGESIAVDDFGNSYITGNFQGIADFDPSSSISNLTSLGGYDIFVFKLGPSGLGIETLFKEDINVFPNPASTQITISIEDKIEQVSIFSLAGELVQVENNPSKKISVANLTSGVYFLKVKSTEGTTIAKFVCN